VITIQYNIFISVNIIQESPTVAKEDALQIIQFLLQY